MKTGLVTSAFIAVLLFVLFSCKKHSSPAPATTSPKSYIANMGGTRTWYGTWVQHCLLCPPPIDIDSSVTDTFAIVVVDTSEIIVPLTSFTSFDTLYYYATNDSLNTITFNTGAASMYYNGSIIYYYLKDSMVYSTTLSNPQDTVLTNLYTP